MRMVFFLRDWNYTKNAVYLKTREVMGTKVQRVSLNDHSEHDEKLYISFRHVTMTPTIFFLTIAYFKNLLQHPYLNIFRIITTRPHNGK